jgi:PKD repeat protein/lysophospholipase L1-like esterase
VYDPSVELLQDGSKGYVEQPAQQHEFVASQIAPGATFWAGPFIFVPDGSGKIDLAKSVLRKVAGDVDLERRLVTHVRDPALDHDPTASAHGRKDSVVIDFDPIAGASGYRIYRLIDRDAGFERQPLEVTWLTPTKAKINGVAPGNNDTYAISSIVDGRPTLKHPLVHGESFSTSPYPKVEIRETSMCGSYPVRGRLTFTDPDVAMTEFTMSFDGQKSVRTLNNTHSYTIPYNLGATPDGDRDLVIRAKNTDGEQGPALDQTLGTCERYMALGDSYSSGEGAADYDAGTQDDETIETAYNNRCHRSANAYSRTLAKDRADVDTPTFAACSGALIDDFAEPWKDDKGHEHNDRNLDEGRQLDKLSPSDDLVTLTIGGNDAYFADILADCAWNTADCRPKWTRKADDKIAQLGAVGGPLDKLYGQIQSRVGDRTRVMVVGYAPIFAADPPWGCIKTLIFEGDEAWMRNREYIFNQHVRELALRHGFEYVDLWDRFAGHEACGRKENWINSANPKDHEESFHPNALGHQAIADALSDQLATTAVGSAVLKIGEETSKTMSVTTGQGSLVATTRWPGSDVELYLTSPSGRVIDRATVAEDVHRITTPTSETVSVDRPEPGSWTVRARGLQMDPDGELVTLDALSLPAILESPSALVTGAPTNGVAGTALMFDASGSTSPRAGTLALRWDFGDGGAATGAKVQHSYTTAGNYHAALTVTDSAGQTDTYVMPIEVVAAPVGGGGGDGHDPEAGDDGDGGSSNAGGDDGSIGGGTPAGRGPSSTDGPPLLAGGSSLTGGDAATGGAGGAGLPPAFRGLSGPKSLSATALGRGLRLTLRQAVKGATVKVIIRQKTRGKPGKALGSMTVKATGQTAQVLTVKLGKTVLHMLRGKTLSVEVTVTGPTVHPVTKKLTVKVKR